MALLSGDQNGNAAPSVPVIGCAAANPSGRIQSRDVPPSDATKTSHFPSGDNANDAGSAVPGVGTSSRISGALVSGTPRDRVSHPTASAAIAASATAQGIHTYGTRRTRTVVGSPRSGHRVVDAEAGIARAPQPARPVLLKTTSQQPRIDSGVFDGSTSELGRPDDGGQDLWKTAPLTRPAREHFV
jgi:hypothetical protein